jgi:hypothetical protein
MLKHMLAATLAVVLIAAPATITYAQQPSTEKSDKADAKKAKKSAKKETAAKELSPQQKKMKDCAGKWGDYKKEKNIKGRTEYRKFMSGCLKA